MDKILEIFNWCMANYQQAITGLLAVLGGFSILAKLTPTKWDDNLLAKLIKFIGLV